MFKVFKLIFSINEVLWNATETYTIWCEHDQNFILVSKSISYDKEHVLSLVTDYGLPFRNIL